MFVNMKFSGLIFVDCMQNQTSLTNSAEKTHSLQLKLNLAAHTFSYNLILMQFSSVLSLLKFVVILRCV